MNTVYRKSINNYKDAFKAADITSAQMKDAIEDWHQLYYQKAPSKKEDPCQQIPYTIVRKLTKTAFAEYTATSKDAFAQGVLDALNKKRSSAMQKALIGGEALLKPIPTASGFRFNVVGRDNVLVFGRNDEGQLTDIGTAEESVRDKYYYVLLERRTVDDTGHLTIRNMLYQSSHPGDLGQQVSLNTLPEYAQLPDRYTFPQPIGSVGLASLRTPMENCVDGSRDAVSVYAAAVGLIHNINVNEAQLCGEFKRGESRIIVSEDMFRRDEDGNRVFTDHIFVGVNESAEDIGVTIFSPALREASFLARKTEYLRNCENIIGLKRGLLSEVEAADRTAKEITSSEGDYSLTVTDFQRAWEETAREALRLCGLFGQMYKVPGAHEINEDDVSFSFGNGVLYDEEKVGSELLAQVQMGLLQPERYLGWYYKLPCETEVQRAKIRRDYMPEIEKLLDE